MPSIYIWKNLESQKVYVGQTVNFDKRKTQHTRAYRLVVQGKERSNKLYNAMKSYGFEKFEMLEVFYVFDRIDLNHYERLFVEEYNSFKDGYNLTNGGSAKCEWDESICKNRSLLTKESWDNEEIREKRMIAFNSEAYKSARKTIAKNIWLVDGYREKWESEHKKARDLDSYKENQSNATKRRWDDPEWRASVIEAQNKGRATDEYRKLRSEIARRNSNSPEFKEKVCKAVVFEGMRFESIGEALKYLNNNTRKLYTALKTGKAHYINKLTGEPIIKEPK